MYDYLIIGAGLFGSVFAERMGKNGKKCLIIEKKNHVAGHIFTEKRNEIDVHVYGAHIFHTSNQRVWDYVNKFTEFNNFINSPMAIYKDEIYNLPFNMNTFSKMWNIHTPQEAKKIIQKQINESSIGEPQNLEEQAIKLVGRDIYEKLIRGYTTKQWGKDPKDLPAFIIKRLPVRYTYDNNYFRDKYQGIPVDGYTKMVKNILNNTEIKLNTNYFDDRQYYDSIADKVLYTGPIDEFFEYKFGTLEYRALRFEHEILDTDNYQGNAVVNYTSIDVPYTRILEHKHFNFTECNHTIITREYPSNWKVGEDPYYPVNDNKNSLLFKKYEELAKKSDRYLFGGRLAEYKYYDMHQVIESALNLVDDELKNK